MIKLNPLVKNHVLKHMACLVLEHAPKCLFFLSIKIDRVRKEHFGHPRKIIWKKQLSVGDSILVIIVKQGNEIVKS